MTASTSSLNSTSNNDPYLVQNDAAELARIQELAGAAGQPGYGDLLMDDQTELSEMFQDFGIRVDRPGTE